MPVCAFWLLPSVIPPAFLRLLLPLSVPSPSADAKDGNNALFAA